LIREAAPEQQKKKPSVTKLRWAAMMPDWPTICLLLDRMVLLPPHPVQGAQVDQDVDEGILVGNGLAIA
jgi:hypothetical protein